MTWTEEKVETLIRMYSERASYAAIGEVLGISRHAIAGKLFRLHLTTSYKEEIVPVEPALERPPSEVPTLEQPAPVEPQAHQGPPPVDRALSGQDQGNATMQLKSTSCRWPLWEYYTEDHKYCMKQIVANETYCERHCRLAYPGRRTAHNG